jgi:hypothetical protein
VFVPLLEEYHEPVCDGVVGFYEGAEEILVIADFRRVALVRNLDCADTRVGGRSFHLHIILRMALILFGAGC